MKMPDKIKNKGSIVHKPVHLIDFMPTLQEVIGAAYPKNFNGESILPSPGQSFLSQMLGKGSQERDGPIFWEWRHGKAIREGDWKLVAHRDVWELYNLKNDPVEEINLIDREPEKAAALEKQYTAWAQQFSN